MSLTYTCGCQRHPVRLSAPSSCSHGERVSVERDGSPSRTALVGSILKSPFTQALREVA
jgi:hypothetical protein